jgi:hypothetical protein
MWEMTEGLEYLVRLLSVSYMLLGHRCWQPQHNSSNQANAQHLIGGAARQKVKCASRLSER